MMSYDRKDNTALVNSRGNGDKILGRFKGLREQMQPGEFPLLSMPGIWDANLSENGGRSMPCDIVLTNQRIFGYAFTTFPRTRLFLDALPLSTLTTISLRQKRYEPLFRELLISNGQHKVYIRARSQQIATLYDSLRTAIEQYAPSATRAIQNQNEQNPDDESTTSPQPVTPIYGKQEIRGTFEHSLLAIVLLFVGGLLLELMGVSAWIATGNVQIGLPLCVAGLLAFWMSLVARQQRTTRK